MPWQSVNIVLPDGTKFEAEILGISHARQYRGVQNINCIKTDLGTFTWNNWRWEVDKSRPYFLDANASLPFVGTPFHDGQKAIAAGLIELPSTY